jgi:hypothetical protein
MDPENIDLDIATDDDLNAGFDDAQPTETPAARTETNDGAAEVAEAQPAETPAPKLRAVTEDEWAAVLAQANLVPELRQQLDKQAGTAFGKIGGIERTLGEMRAGITVAVSDEEIADVEQDFPAVASALRKIKGAAPTLTEDAVGNIVAQRLESQRQEFEKRLLARDHEDWEAVTNGAEFAKFAQSQGAEFVQGLAQASQQYDSTRISKAISQFKAALPKSAPVTTTPNTRQQRLAAAVLPRGQGATPPGKSDDDELLAGFRSG